MYDILLKQLRGKTYNSTEVGNTLISCASSLVPQCGHSGIADGLPFAIGSLFASAGVKFNVEEVVNSHPSDNTIQ